jgi:succinate-semialdehyde dehydrogenase/glutarate-semialdehyde dehydrogenase
MAGSRIFPLEVCMNAPAQAGLASLSLRDSKLFREQCYIDGAWCDAEARKTIAVHNPATGTVLGAVPRMGGTDAKRAIEAAERAWPAWRAKTAKERAVILRKWFDLMMANQEDLAQIMTAEQGKPLTESRGEIAYGASFIEWFAEEGKRAYGDTIPSPWADKRIVVMKQPIGVCALITPWNFPNAMITRKAGPALAAGCTVVIKPAGQTPYSALALAELGERAGIPKGVLNILTGDSKAIGAELCANPIVRKLSFTGSTETGRVLMRQCSAATRRSSSSTTPTSTRRSRARSPPSTAMPARPASARTACMCRTAFMTASPRSSPRRSKTSRSAPATSRA